MDYDYDWGGASEISWLNFCIDKWLAGDKRMTWNDLILDFAQ
jgi:hypothetical protein